MSVPDHLRQWVSDLPPPERTLLQVLLEHTHSHGLSALEMAGMLKRASELFQAMHDSRTNP